MNGQPGGMNMFQGMGMSPMALTPQMLNNMTPQQKQMIQMQMQMMAGGKMPMGMPPGFLSQNPKKDD